MAATLDQMSASHDAVIKQEQDGEIPSGSVSPLSLSGTTSPSQELCTRESSAPPPSADGSPSPAPHAQEPTSEREDGDPDASQEEVFNMPTTDKGYLPRSANGERVPRKRSKKSRGKKKKGKKGRGNKRKAREMANPSVDPQELKKYRSAEYTKLNQQMRTEARLKRLQEIYAHEVSGQILDDQMKREKHKLIELENNRRAAKVSRAKKRQYIRDLEQRVEMFSKHIATLEMENAELRSSLTKHGINMPTTLGGPGGVGPGFGGGMGGMDPNQGMPAGAMDPMMQMMMMGMMPGMGGGMGGGMMGGGGMGMMGGMGQQMGQMGQQAQPNPPEQQKAPEQQQMNGGVSKNSAPSTAGGTPMRPKAEGQANNFQEQMAMMGGMGGMMGGMGGMMGGMGGMGMDMAQMMGMSGMGGMGMGMGMENPVKREPGMPQQPNGQCRVQLC